MDKKERHNFFNFNIGHVVILISWIVGASIYIGEQRTTQVNQNRLNQEFMSKIEKMDQRIIDLDKSGSQLSRSDTSRLTSMEVRVVRLEEYIPKITTLDVRLGEMSNLLREVRDDIKKMSSR